MTTITVPLPYGVITPHRCDPTLNGRATLNWTADDPLAVAFHFPPSTPRPFAWHDLGEALHGPVGDGDLRIRPIGVVADERRHELTFIGFTKPGRTGTLVSATLHVPTASLELFVSMVRPIWSRDAVDAELDALLARCTRKTTR